jgi:hypothetical protein
MADSNPTTAVAAGTPTIAVASATSTTEVAAATPTNVEAASTTLTAVSTETPPTTHPTAVTTYDHQSCSSSEITTTFGPSQNPGEIIFSYLSFLVFFLPP